MSPNYTGYSLDELYDALENINKDLYPENYTRLLSEISSREHAAGVIREQQQHKHAPAKAEKLSGENRNGQWSIPPFNVPSSGKRIFWILAPAILVSFVVVMCAESATISPGGIIVSVLMAATFGSALVHSFLCGWTLSRYGIITLKDDTFSFTILQLFYSYLTCFITLLTIVRLP